MLILAHHKLSNTSLHSFTASTQHGRLLDTPAGHQVSPALSAASFTVLSHKHLLTAVAQDHHRPCSRDFSPRIWQDHQLGHLYLLQAIRLHDEGVAAALAHLHRLLDHETEVCNLARPILPLPVRQLS